MGLGSGRGPNVLKGRGRWRIEAEWRERRSLSRRTGMWLDLLEGMGGEGAELELPARQGTVPAF